MRHTYSTLQDYGKNVTECANSQTPWTEIFATSNFAPKLVLGNKWSAHQVNPSEIVWARVTIFSSSLGKVAMFGYSMGKVIFSGRAPRAWHGARFFGARMPISGPGRDYPGF
ncbi:MAG: hypothetical protein KJO08_11510 [Gammaproteobacteria bacterium]|nr:hypothetical protein [Gammaproteobacteria bacterium]